MPILLPLNLFVVALVAALKAGLSGLPLLVVELAALAVLRIALQPRREQMHDRPIALQVGLAPRRDRVR